MNQNWTGAVLVVTFALVMAACSSSNPEREVSSNENFIGDAEIPKQELIEVIIGYCRNQGHRTFRKKVVSAGEIAIFPSEKETDYELQVRPIKTKDGKMFFSLKASGHDSIDRTDFLFTRQIITNDGDVGPESFIPINGYRICFTVTAQSVSKSNS